MSNQRLSTGGFGGLGPRGGFKKIKRNSDAKRRGGWHWTREVFSEPLGAPGMA
jgi:hypothetical protein